MSELDNLQNALKVLGDKIESDTASKAEVKKFGQGLADLEKIVTSLKSKEKTDEPTIFADKAQAEEFITCMKGAIARSNKQHDPSMGSSPFYVNKTAGDPLTTTGTAAGIELVPTATSNLFSMLLKQGSVARRISTVYSGVHGNIDLPKRNGTSTAVFTAADDTAVTPTQFGTAKLTLSPKQISVLSAVSDKLLYASAVPVANVVAIDLIEQAGVLEDTAVLIGDGSADYGSITGIKTASNVGSVTLTAANFADSYNDYAQTSTLIDALLDLQKNVHESVIYNGTGEYYLSLPCYVEVHKQKSAQGEYQIDPQSGTFKLGGYNVNVWHRMSTTVNAGSFVAMYGDMKKANVIATGRDMSLSVSTDYGFNKNQTYFRLSYDFQSGLIQPSALARVVLS